MTTKIKYQFSIILSDLFILNPDCEKELKILLCRGAAIVVNQDFVNNDIIINEHEDNGENLSILENIQVEPVTYPARLSTTC